MRYWSTTHQRCQTLIVDAHALPGPADGRRRKDLPPDEIATGKSLYFQQEDNLSGQAIYRMHIQSASPDRLVFNTENISVVRYLMWPLFSPGELQSICFLKRESVDVWRYCVRGVRKTRVPEPISRYNPVRWGIGKPRSGPSKFT
jgi:hypothetical protein